MNYLRSTFTFKTKQQEREDKLAAQQANEVEILDKTIEDSSEKNRNFFIAYLGLLVYVQAIVFSTTDLQLLVSTEGLKLPIVDLSVPLNGFYIVIPIFVIALHFNFLQNLESHHYKLMQWEAAYGGKVPRSRLHPFLFDYAILEHNSEFRRLVVIANNVLCYNLAPITLALLLIRYSDRQEFGVTLWHFLTFWFDIWLVWKMRQAMEANAALVQASAPPAVSPFCWLWLVQLGRFARYLVCRPGLHRPLGSLVLVVTLLTGLIGATNDEYFVTHVQPWVKPLAHLDSLSIDWESPENWLKENHLPAGQAPNIVKEILHFGFKYWISPNKVLITQTLAKASTLANLLLPRITIKETETVWKIDSKELEVSAKLAGHSEWAEYFKEEGKGFLPDPDSLRLVYLHSQKLPRAQLFAAKLQGATLSDAHLEGADLEFAQLQGADLIGAQLIGADLRIAKLQGADLRYAYLQEANLAVAKLQEANFEEAHLQGTNLSDAALQSSRFVKADLQGAGLKEAHLQKANLSEAQLQNANLEMAELQDADLREAQMQEANLKMANLQGADLTLASLDKADLESAELQGALLQSAQLQGAYLNMAQLQGANLTNARLRGTDLLDAQMQGADLTLTMLNGANLRNAQLQGAILFLTNVRGVAGTTHYPVFGLEGQNKLFSVKVKTCEYPFHCSTSVQRNNQAVKKSTSIKELEKSWRHDPERIPESALAAICRSDKFVDELSKKTAVQAFRRSYINLPNRVSDNRVSDNLVNIFQQNSEYKNLLRKIDQTLCTLNICADFRDKIEGLDCTTYAQDEPKQAKN